MSNILFRAKNTKTNIIALLILMLLMLWLIDIATIIYPQKYLQKNSSHGIEIFSYYRVKTALFLGADPNMKHMDESTPFYLAYRFDRKKILDLLIPIVDCENLERVVDSKEKKIGYEAVFLEYSLRCHIT